MVLVRLRESYKQAIQYHTQIPLATTDSGGQLEIQNIPLVRKTLGHLALMSGMGDRNLEGLRSAKRLSMVSGRSAHW